MSPISRGLYWLNQRHPWSHNDHFHAWILKHLPARRRVAVDMGCGQGALVEQLAREFRTVHGSDISPQMRAEAVARTAHLDNVVIDDAQIGVLAEPIDSANPDHNGAPIDLITMIAVLHHMDVDDTFAEVARTLAPGGKLLVVGLTVSSTPRDYAWDIASAVTNPIIGMIKHPQPRRRSDWPTKDPFPVKDPTVTFTDLAEAVDRHLPGARLRHSIGFRYTLEWTKPYQ